MKQRAKVYKGKRVVMGDKNRVTKHEIHVNDIPQEGGNSGGGSASSVEYLDVSGVDNSTRTMLVSCAALVRAKDDGLKIIPGGLAKDMGIITTSVKAVGLTLNEKIYTEASGLAIMSLKEYFSMVFGDAFAAIPRLTESEFYTL